MIKTTAFFRPSFHVVALAMCSLAFAGSASPASARSHHGTGRHSHHVGHYAMRLARHHRHAARLSREQRRVAQDQSRGFDPTRANAMSDPSSYQTTSSFSVSNVVAEARSFIGGGNPTGRASLWCARFMNLVLQRTGHQGTGSDLAASFAHYGHRVSGPQVGAIAVMARRGGGHVGVVSGIDAQGNPILISGNNGNRVREAPVSRGRVYAYVLPN